MIRKLILIFIALSFFSVCFAGSIQDMHKAVIAGKNAAAVGCGGTQTFVGDPGDTETFEFEAADFCCTEFSEVDIDTIINTYDNTQVKNGSYALSIALTGANQDDNYVQADFGSGDADFTVDFWYYLYDAADYNSVYIHTATTTTNPAGGDGWNIRHDHFSTGKAHIYTVSAINNDTSIDITTNQWIRLEVDYNKNGASTVKIYDATNTLKDTLNFTAENNDLRYLSFGCIYSNADATNTHYYDDVRYKSGGGGF